MLFKRQPEGEPYRRVSHVRDIVEIVAIIAAGVWAIYVFVYMDRIEPFQKPVAPVIDASMTVVGAKGDVLAVRISQSLKNLGPAKLYILGRIANVLGTNVRLPDNRALRYFKTGSSLDEVRARFSFSHFEPAFTYIDRNPDSLGSGQTFSYSSIIYVPRGRYDALVLDADFAYTRSPQPKPLAITSNKAGVPAFAGRDFDTSGSEIQTSLWH
jgi:hypothetical protein